MVNALGYWTAAHLSSTNELTISITKKEPWLIYMIRVGFNYI